MLLRKVFTEKPQDRCKGFRLFPQFGLWIWFIVIKCLISLPCIFSKCQGVDISVSLYPEGLIYLRYGDPLEIFCIAGKAHELEFFSRGERIESKIVNNTVRRLYIEHLEEGVHTYYCKNMGTNKQCTSRVLVDSPPANVTDFSCISNNLEVLTCKWPYNTRSKVNHTLTLGNNFSRPCTALRVDGLWFCTWNTTSQPRYNQMEDYCNFQLTSCNFLGCNEEKFRVNHFSIVRPDPPSQLKVVSKTPHSVLLQWYIPNNIVDFLRCPIVHKIEYQMAKDDKMYSLYVSHLPPLNKTYKYLLSNLPYAHTIYDVRVSLKSSLATEDKFWSEFTYITFTTDSELPQIPPKIPVGAFYQTFNNNKRVIYLYWKRLDQNQENGENFTYKIIVRQGTNDTQTLYPDKSKTLSYVILDDTSLEAINVTIWSTNVIGSSVNSSHIYISEKRYTEALTISSLSKYPYENGTYKLSWVALEHIDSYTLFWCEYSSARVCDSRLSYTVLNGDVNQYVINFHEGKRYQFAISAQKGTHTGGMTWATYPY